MPSRPRKRPGFAARHKVVKASGKTPYVSVASRLAALLDNTASDPNPVPSSSFSPLFSNDPSWEDEGPSFDGDNDTIVTNITRAQRRRDNHATKANDAFDDWFSMLPSLTESYVQACARTGRPDPSLWSSCGCSCRDSIQRPLRVLSLAGIDDLTIPACSSHFVPNIVRAGLFPANTIVVHTAFSFELMRLFRALQRHSRLGAHGFIKALFDYYTADQGYAHIDDTRKQLKRASLWFGVIEQRIQERLYAPAVTNPSSTLILPQDSYSFPVRDPDLQLTLADLASRCPACFGGLNSNSPSSSSHSPQVIVCLDGNFTHKRRKRKDAITRSPASPTFFLSARQVDEAERSFKASAQTDGPRTGCSSEVKAAVEGAVKASKGAFDVVGVIGMTCRHGSPLLFCDVRGTGEAHFYAFALLDHLIRACSGQLRSLGICYDIGCKLSASPRIKASLRDHNVKLSFAVSLFHVFGHDLDCQLKFSPRRTFGFGLTDGESLERLWSAMGDLISVTRSMTHVGRHRALSSHLAFLASDHIARLSSFLKTRLIRVKVERIKAAPHVRVAAASVATHPAPPVLNSTPPAILPGFPNEIPHLLSSFERLSLQRQKNAFARPTYRRKKKHDTDPLHLPADALYVALSQWHALDSFSKRRETSSSQKSQQRLATAKAAALSKAKRLRHTVNDTIKAIQAKPPTPGVEALSLVEEGQLFLPETLARVARYSAFHTYVKEPWFLDSLLMGGLDAYEMLVRSVEEESRVQDELENLRTWLADRRTILGSKRDSLHSIGWIDVVAREIQRIDTLEKWWKRPPPKRKDYDDVLDTGDGFDPDGDDQEDEDGAVNGEPIDHSAGSISRQQDDEHVGEDDPADIEDDEFDVDDTEYDAKYGYTSINRDLRRRTVTAPSERGPSDAETYAYRVSAHWNLDDDQSSPVAYLPIDNFSDRPSASSDSISSPFSSFCKASPLWPLASYRSIRVIAAMTIGSSMPMAGSISRPSYIDRKALIEECQSDVFLPSRDLAGLRPIPA
ncbi:hypothetical protein CF326_g3215 [Tilletia indica]|nr:hypothetical protein CF326_g3215 [Tilletia indica]